MDLWLWVAAYLLGTILLLVYLYQYYVQGTPSGEATAESARAESTDVSATRGTERPVPAADNEGDDSTEELVRCENCDTANRRESMFVYCRECGDELE